MKRRAVELNKSCTIRNVESVELADELASLRFVIHVDALDCKLLASGAMCCQLHRAAGATPQRLAHFQVAVFDTLERCRLVGDGDA